MSAARLSRPGTALRHALSFLLAAGAVYAAALAVAAALPRVAHAGVVAAALTADLALGVPLLYWLLLVRGRGWPRFSVVPVFVANLAGAALVVPQATPAAAVGEDGGHFAAGGCRFEPRHVSAVRTPGGDSPETLVLFTAAPLEIGLAYAFDPRQAALEALSLSDPPAEKGLILTLRDGIANYFFWCADPPVRLSGHEGQASLTLGTDDGKRIAGDWTLAETTDAGGGTRSWNLSFAADVIDPTAGAEKLPEDGGEAGRAYLAYIEHLAEGNILALREFIDNPWYLAEDADEEEIADDLAALRATQPKTAKVAGGIADGGAAILDVEATLGDGSASTMRVLLEKRGDGWVYGGSSATE